MRVKTHEEILVDSLAANGAAEGTWATRTIFLVAQAERVADLIDLDRGRLRPDWGQLDDPRYRSRVLTWDAAKWQYCVKMLQPKMKAINNLLAAGGQTKCPEWAALEPKLTVAMPTVARKAMKLIEVEPPFPTLWPLVANDLSRCTYARNAVDWVDSEWRYHNTLLLMGFFSSCRLPLADHVRQALAEAAAKPLGMRGVFFRVPELAGECKIEDAEVRITPRTGGLTLSCEALSPLIAATAEESRKIPVGNGILHEIMPIASESSVPFWEWGVVTGSQLREARDGVYKLYENTILAYLALGSIEQILRSWAQRAGRPHMETNETPSDVLKAVEPLVDAGVLTAVKELYDSNSTNLRNRVMHGNLLEVESKRLETDLPIADWRRWGYMSEQSDSFAPTNVAQFCLECLEKIDADLLAKGVTLVPADLSWATGLALSSAEIDLGLRLSVDFLEDNGEPWRLLMGRYLNALFPGLKQLWTLGFVAWLDKPFRPSLPRFMALGFSFEALFRTTVQLLGGDVLQRSRPRARKVLKTQYRMLDKRPMSIANNAVLARLVRHVPPKDQHTAVEILELAIKARNSLAHGAVTVYDDRTSDGLGHILVKAGQTLITAGLHHLISERAFYKYKNDRKEQDGFTLTDWLSAEKEIHEWICAIGT